MTPTQRAYLCGYWDNEAHRPHDDTRFKTQAERTSYMRGWMFCAFISQAWTQAA